VRKLYLWWKTRNWRPEDHDDCMSFMGPCIAPSPSCAERLEYVRLCNPPPKAQVHSE
jgi:hypothetical protein